MSKFVEAVAKATGRTQLIPAHWLDNPVLGAGFEPLKPATPAPAPAPVVAPVAQPEEAEAPAKAKPAQKNKES